MLSQTLRNAAWRLVRNPLSLSFLLNTVVKKKKKIFDTEFAESSTHRVAQSFIKLRA